jgi:ribose transport system substrate-binding protein
MKFLCRQLFVLTLAFAAFPALADKTVGVILLTKAHQFTRDLADEIADRGPDFGMRIDIQYAEFDVDRQSRMIDGFLLRKYDAVLLTPVDSLKLDPAIERLNRAGIPVFTVDIANEGPRGAVICHIASDNTQGGMAAAALLAEALKGKGNVVIINHPKVTSVQQRVEGFRRGLEAWPGIRIVADIPSWGQRARAQSIMDDFMLMMPDIQGVFAINDESVMGALKSVQTAGKGGTVIVGYDGTPEVRAEIDRKQVFADVVQYPRELARQSLKAIDDYFSGRPVPRQVVIPTGTVR